MSLTSQEVKERLDTIFATYLDSPDEILNPAQRSRWQARRGLGAQSDSAESRRD